MTSSNKLGVAALLLYVPHAAWHIAHGAAWDLLWMCDVAMPLLALGCFTMRARAVATACLFLLFGTPLWLLDLLVGGHMVPTSPLIHVGGLAVACLGIRTLGWPRYSWAVASFASAVILGLSRLFSPPDANINMAFRIYQGWDEYFSSHELYVLGLWLSATAIFLGFERAMHRGQLR